jgi:hypothetical protein
MGSAAGPLLSLSEPQEISQAGQDDDDGQGDHDQQRLKGRAGAGGPASTIWLARQKKESGRRRATKTLKTKARSTKRSQA